MSGSRLKLTEIWDSAGGVSSGTYVTFDLVVFKVILGSFSALVSKYPLPQKCVSVEKKNRLKFGDRGMLVEHVHVWGNFDL